MERTIYALPRSEMITHAMTKEQKDAKMMEIYSEIEELRKKRYGQITKWKCRPVELQYAFEMPIMHGWHKLLEIKYESRFPALPANLTGKTFQCLFGANQSMLELFILEQKIKGPCWLTINNVKKVQDYRMTWCKHEITIDSPKNVVITVDDINKESPPLSALSFSFKTTRSIHNTNEIAMISCVVLNEINIDKPTLNAKQNYRSFTLVRKLDKTPLPLGLEQKVRDMKESTIQVFTNERQMFETFVTKFQIHDPDIVIAHNLCGGVFETLLARLTYLKINHWSRIGRFKRNMIPKQKGEFGGQWIPRVVTPGRLLLDTFLNSKELIRETNYDLTHLAK